MKTARHLAWSSADHSHVGMVRKINEDAYLALPELGLWAVADGMGGHEAGDVASRMVIDNLRQAPPPADWETFITTIRQRLQNTNQQLMEESEHHYQNRTIGSTVVILLAYQDIGSCLWVGDSRLYRLRDGHLQQLTRDHSQIQDLIDEGLVRPEEAHDHPLSNVITRAVGSSEYLEIDAIHFKLQAGDVFLLCSDGLNKVVSDTEIASLLTHGNGQDIVHALVHLALVRGATDNITTVVVTILEKNMVNDDNTKPLTSVIPPSPSH